MSAPISINVASSESKLTSSSPTSPGLYVPIHKRVDSSSSSPSSPTTSSTPAGKYILFYLGYMIYLLMMDATIAKTPSYVYSRNTLLSLLPFADESMKGKMRENCPEVVMNRKTRKGLEFNGRSELFAAKQLLKQEQIRSASVVDKRPAAPTSSPTPTPASTLTRVSSRRSRPTGRAPERRRNPFTSTFGGRRTGDDSWRRLQAVPMPPVILL